MIGDGPFAGTREQMAGLFIVDCKDLDEALDIMFCRSLGQSLGAAIFGAIFNATVQARLRTAPAGLQRRLPHQVGAVGTALGNPAGLGRAAAGHQRGAITAATDHVYAGLALAALATIIVILVIIPRQLAITAAAPSGHASPGDAAAADVAIGDSRAWRVCPADYSASRAVGKLWTVRWKSAWSGG